MQVTFRPPPVRGRHLILIDLVTIALSGVLALAVLADFSLDLATVSGFAPVAALLLLVRPLVNLRFGLYRRLWQHASITELVQIFFSTLAGSLIVFALFLLIVTPADLHGALDLPRSFWIVEGLLSLTTLGGTRFAARVLTEFRPTEAAPSTSGIPTLLYGAGQAGRTVSRSARDPRAGVRPVGFIDDDLRLKGQTIGGLEVLGSLDHLEQAVERTGARLLIIALGNADGAMIRRIVAKASALGLEVRTVPPFYEMLDGSLDAYRIRRVRLEDLLRRESVRDHDSGVAEMIPGQTVFITGAGGSIGAELSRQVYKLHPKRIVLVDRAEGQLYGIQGELEVMAKRGEGSGERRVHIANVATRLTMQRLVREHKPQVIFHAAAYKHVPMMEEHPSDAVQVNIGGTLAVLDAAEANDVPHFVLVSTDKAVRPSSVMGATKRVAEALVRERARRTGRRYVAVRFGNVLGSSGSVVPIFQRQLEEGQPLTITHPDMTRYFMTIPEAVWLILDAAAIGKPGNILVLDMGEPIRIVDLANDLIRLSGRDPNSVPIEFTGLRPGEKLHEELFYATERVTPTVNKKVMLAAAQVVPDDIIERAEQLRMLAMGDEDTALRAGLFALTDLLEEVAAARPAREASVRSGAPAASVARST